MTLIVPNKDEQEETAPIIANVVDTGDFGYNTCGKCGSKLGDEYLRCPCCGIKLGNVELSPSSGGSDF